MVSAGWFVTLVLLWVLCSVSVTACFWFLCLVAKLTLTETEATSDPQLVSVHARWSPDLSPGPEPDPWLIIYIDLFRIHQCLNQGLAGIYPPLAQGK